MKNPATPLILFLLLFSGILAAQSEVGIVQLPQVGSKILVHSGWFAAKASDIQVNGSLLTKSLPNLKNWMPARVPGTILSTLISNGVYPDPLYAFNNDSIPDIYDTGNDFYTYWFLNAFYTNSIEKDKRYWLNFRGINYSAEIFLNGKKLNAFTHTGMFLRESYDITGMLRDDGSPNILAVIVLPPDPPGKGNGGQGGDGMIGKCVTHQYVAGWDWIPPVRDRNTGIWDEVSITTTGSVTIVDPSVITIVPGKRVPQGKQKEAFIKVKTELVNHANSAVSGIIICNVDQVEVRKKVVIPVHGSLEVALPDLKIHNPKLWWPNGIGEQPLYDLKLRFLLIDNTVSDSYQAKIGMRTITTEYDTLTRSRKFLVNGQKVFIRGGNWVTTDWMLNLSKNRYDQEIRLHKEMNLNLIRIWGGSITERPEFYEACDLYGLLVMQDLWITGDCNGAWNDPMKTENRNTRRKYPDDHALFIESAIDQIKMLRNHPSLCFWCGGNEFHPPVDVDSLLKYQVFPTYDPTRLYVNSSFSRELTMKFPDKAGDGPYGIMEPDWFYFPQLNPFNPEMGSVGLPEIESLRKILPLKEWVPPTDLSTLPGWKYHRFLGYNDHVDRFGSYGNLEEYCKQAQLVNYLQYKSFLEGETSNMFKCYTGVVIWRSQNPWTALGGQMYDRFLAQNGAYYGVKNACEPVHIQLNLDDTTIAVVNMQAEALKACRWEYHILDPAGKELGNATGAVDLKSQSVTEIVRLIPPAISDALYFVDLYLKDATGQVLSRNLLWMNTFGKDYSSLKRLPEAKLDATLVAAREGDKVTLNVSLENSGESIAFFNHLLLKDMNSGERILPAFYSDNYFSLTPGEKKSVKIDFEAASNPKILLELEGWNSGKIKLEPHWEKVLNQ